MTEEGKEKRSQSAVREVIRCLRQTRRSLSSFLDAEQTRTQCLPARWKHNARAVLRYKVYKALLRRAILNYTRTHRVSEPGALAHQRAVSSARRDSLSVPSRTAPRTAFPLIT